MAANQEVLMEMWTDLSCTDACECCNEKAVLLLPSDSPSPFILVNNMLASNLAVKLVSEAARGM